MRTLTVCVGVLSFWVAASAAISITGLGYMGGNDPSFWGVLTFSHYPADLARILGCFAIPYAICAFFVRSQRAGILIGASIGATVAFNAANAIVMNLRGFDFAETVAVFFAAPLFMGMMLPSFLAFAVIVASLSYLNPHVVMQPEPDFSGRVTN